MSVLNVILQFLKTPAILIGVVALIGLILQKKSFTQVILGTVKTILGFLILNMGVNTAVGGLKNFDALFAAAFGLKGIYLDDNIAVGAMMSKIGQDVGLVMVFGFLANIIIARFTKAKFIYLTGHKVWHMAGGIAFALLTMGFAGVPLVAVGAIILGAYMSLQPLVLQKYTKEVTGSDEYAMAHSMSFIYLFSGFVGKLVGNKEKKIDDVKLPTGLEAIRDIAVAFSLIMFVMFAVPAIFAPEKARELAGSTSVPLWIVIQSLTAAGGIMVVLQGVRMFIGELIPAFKGFASKLVPGAVPGLDCPIVFPFSPTGLVVGLITGFLGWLVGMFLCNTFGLAAVPVPSVIGIMFGIAPGAIYGNATGGTRGAFISSFLAGILFPIAGALFYPVLPFEEYGVVGSALMSPDIYIVVSLLKGIGALFGLG